MNNNFPLFLLVQAFNKLILHPDKSKIILSHTSQKNFNFQSFYQYWLEKKRKAMSIGRTQGTHHVLEQRLIPRVYGVRGSLGTWWVWERLERTRGLLVAPRFRVISLVVVRVRGTNTLGKSLQGNWPEATKNTSISRQLRRLHRKIHSCVFWSSFEPIVINLKPIYQRRRWSIRFTVILNFWDFVWR